MNAAVGPGGTALVIGYQGGVGRALLGLLRHRPACRKLVQRIDRLLLLDARSDARPAAPWRGAQVEVLAPQRIESPEALAALLRAHAVDQLIEVSSLGTLECIDVCSALGVAYLSTSVQAWPGKQASLQLLMDALLAGARRRHARASHLIGAGMNPGVVNALALCAVERLAARVGKSRAPALGDLELHGLLVTEDDTTTAEAESLDADVFPMSWSPQAALDELLEPRALAVRGGEVVQVGHAPFAARYRARCKDRLIDAMLVPHEEVISLGRRLRDTEIAFLYRLPPGARRALASHPERRRVSDWRTRRLYPPFVTGLRGGDCVGALVCSRKYGELWLGFDTGVEAGLAYGTNATQLQVAAGVIAGWSQLGAVAGVHVVEDLNVHAYCAAVEAILGPALEVYDPLAPPRALSDRRVWGSLSAV